MTTSQHSLTLITYSIKKYRNALSFSQYSYGEPFYTRLNLRYEF
ncbi:Uncharacterised protein [Mannheimia haemolytica]|uniref:Uncharacterized protein n=1 Tax=Mannheimia haemolytica TaxID=75985 RepID=A0A378MXZ4_MANHA|nr:Uncharacterised protein [Mannheimia haemolytica]